MMRTKMSFFFLLVFMIIFLGCEAVFTYSPITFLASSPEDLSPDDQITYAEAALESSDPEFIAAALSAIDSAIDEAEVGSDLYVELNQTAVTLTLSGVDTAVTDLLATPDFDFEDLDTEAILESFSDLGDSADDLTGYIANLDSDEVSPDQYVMAAALVVIDEVNSDDTDTVTVTDPSTFSTETQDLIEDYLTAAEDNLADGESSALLEQLAAFGLSLE